MVKGLYTAYTGMINEQKRLDVLSNNLANADTNGYKKDARNGNVNGRIQVDTTQKITVDELGNIYQNDQQVGTIGIVDFADYDYLAKYGENMYDLVNGGTVTAADGRIVQGTLESSNVNVVSEMVNMITISRAYQAGQKVINTIDETLDKAVNQVGNV